MKEWIDTKIGSEAWKITIMEQNITVMKLASFTIFLIEQSWLMMIIRKKIKVIILILKGYGFNLGSIRFLHIN